MQSLSIVLNNFQEFYLTNPIAQDKLIKHLAYMMASAKCIKENVTSSDVANKIHRETIDKVKQYAVSEKHIKTRQYNFLPDNFYNNYNSLEVDNHHKSNLATSVNYNSITVTALQNDTAVLQPNNTKENSKFSKTHSNFLSNPNGLNLKNRMFLYQDAILKLMQQAYPIKELVPNTIIHTTCLGYISPSPVQTYLSTQDWLTTQVINAYHMGCYAAIPTAHIGISLVSASHNTFAQPCKVDVVHSELSSLHLNVMDDSPGHIVNSTLFSDGLIKYSISQENDLFKQKIKGLKALAIETLLIKNALTEMTLVPGPFQFDIYISKNVPGLIGNNIKHFMQQLCNQLNLDFDKIKHTLHFAIHPGGPKIVDHIQEVLDLRDDQIHFSRNIFYNFGNMVSATLPHVWKDIVNSDDIKPGEKIISVAFGPGLTVTGMMFEKV